MNPLHHELKHLYEKVKQDTLIKNIEETIGFKHHVMPPIGWQRSKWRNAI